MSRRILLSDSLRFWGGIERWFYVVAETLSARGWEPVIAGREDSALLERARRGGIQTVAWPFRRDFDPRTVARAWRHMSRTRTDIAVVHMGRDLRTTGLAARLCGVPLVWRMGIPLPNYRWGHRLTGGWADRVIVPSESLRVHLTPFPWLNGKVTVVPNGIPEIAAPSDEKRAASRSMCGWDSAEFVILYVGRLEESKGADILLSAFATLCSEHPHLRLVIVGTGTEEEKLHRQADSLGCAARVQFMGFQSDTAVFYEACDILVMPSRRESFGLVLLEAMMRATPVVATNVGGIPEVVGEGSAILVPPENVPALADAIRQLTGDTARRRSLATAARARVLQRFTEARMVDQVETVLHEVLGEHGRAPAAVSACPDDPIVPRESAR